MRQLIEFVPIVLFFVVYQMDGETLSLGGWQYQFDGIYSATAVLIVATAAQLLVASLLERRLDRRALWTLVAVSVFGGATLLLRDERFIQWKPTLFNWGLALVFIGFQLFSRRNLMERTLGKQLQLPAPVWARLNALWVANFLLVGALNLWVAQRFSESTWVSYKLWSAIGFTLLLTLLTAVLVSPYLKAEHDSDGDG